MSEQNLESTVLSVLSPEQKVKIQKMSEKIALSIALVERLRGPKGCPWDREQDHLTLRPYLIEEAYEVLDILDQYIVKKDPKENAKSVTDASDVPPNGKFEDGVAQKLKEELGDLFLQILLHSKLSQDRGDFDLGDVSSALVEKLVYRHPHVFSNQQTSSTDGLKVVKDAEQVVSNWELLKKKEGKKGLLDGLPRNLPSLTRAARIGDKARSVGFDWNDWQGSMLKVDEEVAELKAAIDSKDASHIEEEVGDLFFAICNLSRHLKVSPEDAHRKALFKFENRFRKLEEVCHKRGIEMQKASLETLDSIWNEIKR